MAEANRISLSLNMYRALERAESANGSVSADTLELNRTAIDDLMEMGLLELDNPIGSGVWGYAPQYSITDAGRAYLIAE